MSVDHRMPTNILVTLYAAKATWPRVTENSPFSICSLVTLPAAKASPKALKKAGWSNGSFNDLKPVAVVPS